MTNWEMTNDELKMMSRSDALFGFWILSFGFYLTKEVDAYERKMFCS